MHLYVYTNVMYIVLVVKSKNFILLQYLQKQQENNNFKSTILKLLP